MFKLIIETAVRHRWLVVFMAALIAAVGLFQLGKLPIDAVRTSPTVRYRSTRWHRR